MKRLLALILTVAALLVSAPAQAAEYGKQAAAVARAGDCKNVRHRTAGGQYAHSGVVCDLRGHRIDILTFSSKYEEGFWLGITCKGLPAQWVAVMQGFVITAYDGNRAAAVVGANVYGGKAYLCRDLTS